LIRDCVAKKEPKEKKEKKTAPKKAAKKGEKKEPVSKKPAVEDAVKSETKAAVEKENIEIKQARKEETDSAENRGDESSKTPEQQARPERYWEAVGRRKTAVARVRLFTKGDKGIFVNGKPLAEYFQPVKHQGIVEDALKKMKSLERFRVTVKVSGGGLTAQAEAARHGTARALIKFNPDFRKRLRRAGFLTRDPRMKERKKFGLKKARRAPQWAKR